MIGEHCNGRGELVEDQSRIKYEVVEPARAYVTFETDMSKAEHLGRHRRHNVAAVNHAINRNTLEQLAQTLIADAR